MGGSPLINRAINTGSGAAPAVLSLGSVDGFVVKCSSPTAVAVTSGAIEANGAEYTLASDDTHTMTSLLSAFDFHYIYIDDDASAAPVATIIDSTTEPAWSDSKRGWYNGDDRCIGVQPSTNGAATLIYTENQAVSDRVIGLDVAVSSFPNMALAMNPDSTFQVPNVNDGSVVTPVNAIQIAVRLKNTDVGLTVVVFLASAEVATAGSSFMVFSGPDEEEAQTKINLGASRDIRIGGFNSNDNNLACNCQGFKYQR